MVTKKKAKKAAASKAKKGGAARTAKKRSASASSRAKAAPKKAAKKVVAKKVVAKKAVAKKAVAKKAVAKKALAPSKKPAARKPAARKPTLAKAIRRRDGAGHLDPQYAADLRAKSTRPERDPDAFLNRPRSKDDLVEELGEEMVGEATSAEHEGGDIQDQEVPEERGGPFVETTGAEEFGHGIDGSNPRGAKREPFPTT
jgi:hypothetical protein